MSKLKYSQKSIEKAIKKYSNNDYRIMPNGEIAINSPYVSDTTYDCRINVDKQCYYDFESEEGGNLERLISDIAGVDKEEAKNILISDGSFEFVDTPKKTTINSSAKTIEMPSGSFKFGKNDVRGSLNNFNKAVKFLKGKGVGYKLAKKYDLRWTDSTFISVKDKRVNLSKRIIIPTYEDGKLVYYQARDYTGESKLRYKNPPKDLQSKKIIVPFYDQIIPEEILFVSEGPWEAIQFSGTYMLGPGLSEEQLNKLKNKNPKAVYVIPDNDDTGRFKLAKNVNDIRQSLEVPVYIVKWWDGLENYKDPIDAGLTFEDLAKFKYIEADRHIELKLKMGKI